MSGGKETPRQKMIGMMYLVLTALLALNVSKEILSAFVTLENKLRDTTANFDKKNAGVYSGFEAAMALPGQEKTAKKWYEVAKKIRTLADNKFNYINELKLEVVRQAESGADWQDPDNPWVNEARKIKRLKSMEHIHAKDNYDVPTNYFVGSDPSDPNGEGPKLFDAMIEFRDSITFYMGNVEKDQPYTYDPFGAPDDMSNVHRDDTSKISLLRKTLTTPRKIYDDHQESEVFWEVKMFDHAPIVAAVAILTSMQADIRNAESEAVEHIFANVNTNEYNFNKVEAIAYSPSSYVNVGDTFRLSVFMAAFDTLKSPKVIWKKDSTEEGEEMPTAAGQGQLNLAAKSSGRYEIMGQIGVETKSGIKYRPWYYAYEVGAPTAVVSPSELNVLYSGYNNKIEATASGYASDRVSVTCSSCTIKKDKGGEGKYIVTVGARTRKAFINVSGKNADGSSTTLVKKEFKVLPVPPPTPYFGKKNAFDNQISRGEIRNTPSLTAKLKDSPLNVNFKVTQFEMAVNVNGQDKTIQQKGFLLNPRMKKLLKQLKPGANVSFRNIRAKGPGPEVRLGSMSFKVTK